MRSCKSVVWLVAILLLGCAGLFAQTPTAQVTGTVLDSSGGTVPGATVKVTNQETNIVSEKDTNEAGAFTIINLLPGPYVLTVEKTGFRTVALPVFKLDVNQILTEKITMQVGASTETVTVTASAVGQMIQRSSTELGTIIDEQAVRELPMNGRSFTSLLILQPGVSPVDTSQGNSNGNTGVGGGGDGGNISIPGTVAYKPSVNGAGNRSNSFYLDGIVDTDDRGGSWAVPVIADTIQEFKVQSHNDDPSYGNVLGAVVNVVSKSGTNSFHGGAWEFARSQIFDARNPFTGFCNASQCPAEAAYFSGSSTTKPSDIPSGCTTLSCVPVSPLGYSQNEFGGTIGGPIFKNKTFFYLAYEGWRYSKPTNTYVIDPSGAELAGDFTGTVTPELIGPVNSTKTAVTPNTIYNPFAETGASMSVPFYCDSTGAPEPLQTPGAAFGTSGYGIQVGGGTACNKIPAGLIDSKLAQVINAYTSAEYKNCAFTPNYTFAVDNCLDSRPTTNNADNMDARIDQHFGSKDTIFARAYMFWNSPTAIVAGTTSLSPSPYHSWNIGGAWDHIFNPDLILEVRGGGNMRPVQVNPTNAAGYTPESTAGYTNLGLTAGFFLNVGGYIGSANSGIGNVGPQFRANPESNASGMLTWTHGTHNIKMGAEYLYEDRLEINTYETFVSSATQTCPTNSSGNFACGSNQGNGLASMLLDLPSSLTVNVPQYEEIHVSMQPIGGFIQDNWHIRPNLTINLGFRYDYDPAVKFLAGSTQTVNAYDFPDKQYVIGGASSAAYTSGCSSSILPPCVPGGLTSNPALTVTVGSSTNGGPVTYNTLSNIVFTGGSPGGLKSIRDNIGPRVGFAWQFLPNTVLRVGYGIYYDTISYRSQYAENELQGSIWPWTRGVSDTLNTADVNATPSTTVNPICAPGNCGVYGGYNTSQLSGLVGSNPIVVAPTPWGSTFGGYTNAPNYSDPRSQQWNLNIERQLSASTMIMVGYVGSKTQRLDWCCFANYPQGGPFCVTGTCPTGTTPLTQTQIAETEYMPWSAQGMHYSESVGFSTYHALEAQFQKRFSHGFETLLAFTWQRCMADTSGDFNAENGNQGNPNEYYFNQQLAYGPCAFDVPKLIQWSGVYALPFGQGERWLTHGPLSWVLGNWEANFAFLSRSGQDYNPTWNGAGSGVPASIAGLSTNSNDPANLSNAAGSITGYSRPSLVPGCQAVQTQSVTAWYNPACFVSPASPLVGPGYGFGNEPLGSLRTQWWNNVDFSLAKSFKITESKTLQLRFEGFNVFNHMVLTAPNRTLSPSISGGVLSYGSAGVVSNIANTPRELQLAAKFNF
ncbi:MAG: carboxypeptidase regulatory-like domain-containing protein [Candidatus Acidiferrales bacterium]